MENDNTEDIQIQEAVRDYLLKGELFFFAGAGVSIKSNLPSVPQILKHTMNVVLPSSVSEHERAAISKIQPEVFYEAVLQMTETLDSLHLWRCLHGDTHKKMNLKCGPCINHYFIALYSFTNKKPIFTTNFDAMFEEAACDLEIKFKVFLPDEPPPKAFDDDCLYICKLHGSIQNQLKQYSPGNLKTIMTDITRANYDWLAYIEFLMSQHHICYAGYSGRDIDFFPFVAGFSRNESCKQVIWISDFSQCSYTDANATACKAGRINMFPDVWFGRFISENAWNVDRLQSMTNNAQDLDEKQKKERYLNLEVVLSNLENEFKQLELMNQDTKELLYILLLFKLRNYQKVYEQFTLSENLYNRLSISHQRKYLLMFSRICHEVSLYDSCRNHAMKVLERSDSTNDSLCSNVQALCLISESYRMGIPNDLYFDKKHSVQDYLNLMFVLMHFAFVNIRIERMLEKNESHHVLDNAARQERIEHKIRFLAIIQALLVKTKSIANRFIQDGLIKRWDQIKKESYDIGYTSGIGNVEKFLYRVAPDENVVKNTEYIYELMGSATGKELLVRNLADEYLKRRDYDMSLSKFQEFIQLARISGNALNELKGILGTAYVRKQKNEMPLLEKDLYDRFLYLTTKIEGHHYQAYFKYLNQHIMCRKNPNSLNMETIQMGTDSKT